MNKKMEITRRDFLKQTATHAAVGTILLNTPLNALAWASKNEKGASKVVLIRNQHLYDNGEEPDPGISAQMLDDAICALTGQGDSKAAWATIIKSTDVVGIKTNELKIMPTPEILNTLLKERVLQTGIKEENVSVNDRGVLKDPVFLRSTALINIRPMRTHAWAGVGSCIKNMLTFSTNMPSYHDDSCAGLAKLFDLPIIKGKVRLHILAMYRPLFHNLASQHVMEEYRWNYNGIIMGFDPVAVDSVGLRVIQGKRNDFFGEYRPINPPPKHIELADTLYHLGNSDPSNIELIKLGWDVESFL